MNNTNAYIAALRLEHPGPPVRYFRTLNKVMSSLIVLKMGITTNNLVRFTIS